MRTEKKLTAHKDRTRGLAWMVGPEFNGMDRARIGFIPNSDGDYTAYIQFKNGTVKTSAYTDKRPTCKDARDIYRTHILWVDELLVEVKKYGTTGWSIVERYTRNDRGVFEKNTKAK